MAIKNLLPFFLGLAFAAVLGCSRTPAGLADLKTFQGKWEVVHIEANGKEHRR